MGLEPGGIGIYLVEVSVERLDGWLLPRFELVQGPNRWLSATAASGSGARLAEIDEFLALADEGARAELRAIIDDWVDRPGASWSLSTLALALRIAKPAARGATAALTLFADATWINVGYLASAAETIGVDQSEIEELVRTSWPDATPGDKGYYWRVASPRAADARRFADALWSRWSQPSEGRSR